MTKSEEEVPENHPTVTKIMTPKLEEESENHPSVVSVVGNSSLRAPNSSSVPDVAKALRAGKDLTTSSTRYPNGHLGSIASGSRPYQSRFRCCLLWCRFLWAKPQAGWSYGSSKKKVVGDFLRSFAWWLKFLLRVFEVYYIYSSNTKKSPSNPCNTL